MPDFFRRSTPVRKPRFEDVVDTELPILYRTAKRLAHNDTEAEDLVGQTLYLAARAWPTFDGAYPRSWLIKILRNEFLGRRKKAANRPEVNIDDVAEPSEEGYWKAIDWGILGPQILDALDMIPEDYRLAVALSDVEGLTRLEVAEALGIPEGTVNSRLHRGRNLLRARLVTLLGDAAPQGALS